VIGVVDRWFPRRGFGFIRPADGSTDMFCHIRSVVGDRDELSVGDKVEYDEEQDDRSGKWRAADVHVLQRAAS